ncbi:MAG: ZIP family metal transporter [Prolixibacteraceae bacterium]|nr:ZIP family metal transporter [Prolixibacteraceae bacterium]
MSIIWFKIISVVLIITAGITGGIIPMGKKVAKGGNRLTFGNAFAGGVFLGAGLMHLLPDAMENFSSLKLNSDFPFAALICGLGFIFILALERVIARKESAEILSSSKNKFPLILLIVLSIHSIIAGMSLGLETTILSGTVIFIAIIAHKGSASFALGVNLVNDNINKKLIIKTILFFSIMTPVGIVIGTVLDNIESSSTSLWFEAIFDSLAAGTFLYIAVLEIINDVFANGKFRYQKFGFLLIGFLLMAFIAIYA